jgi:hypothetical protein
VLWPKLHGWMWWTRERNITMDWEMEQDRLLTKAAYSCLRGVYVRHGTKYDRAPR